jgi:hypothetical protein
MQISLYFSLLAGNAGCQCRPALVSSMVAGARPIARESLFGCGRRGEARRDPPRDATPQPEDIESDQ